MDDADVERIISHDKAMIGSDGLPHDAHPHPRLWGTFPRVISKWAICWITLWRSKWLMTAGINENSACFLLNRLFTRWLGGLQPSLEVLLIGEVRRVVSFPVISCYNLRFLRFIYLGVIKEGNFADIVVLDRTTVEDVATFQAPIQPSKGVKLVFVNGQIVFKDPTFETLSSHSVSSSPQQPRPGRVLKYLS